MKNTTKIYLKTFPSLSVEELYQLLRLRSSVFVVEQNCAYQDLDNQDQKANHFFIKVEKTIVAYLRFFKKESNQNVFVIGRVVVDANFRNRGYAKLLMQNTMDYISKNMEIPRAELSAQTYLVGFYSSFGLKTIGESYLEDGIPHIKMVYG